MINLVVAIVIGIILHYYNNGADSRMVDKELYKIELTSVASQLLSTTLTAEVQLELTIQHQTVESNLIQAGEEILEIYVNMVYIHLILSAYLVQNIFQYIFARLRHKSTYILTSEIILNSICAAVALHIFITYNSYYKYIEVSEDNGKFVSLEIIDRMNEDEYFRVQVLFAFLSSAQWVRVFFIIRSSKFLGPMIHILLNVFTQVGKFLIGIYLVIFLMFLSLGKIMFLELNEFNSTTSTITTLFSASLGEFDFAIFRANLTLEDTFGYVYFILFLAMSNIVALNFAIAILTHRFDELDKINTGLYLKQIIMIRQVLEKHNSYSGIVSAFVPFNWINIAFSSIILLKKDSRFNTIVLHIFYLPVLLIG
jgi:hypothetical protein